jgi:hypothetical protein
MSSACFGQNPMVQFSNGTFMLDHGTRQFFPIGWIISEPAANNQHINEAVMRAAHAGANTIIVGSWAQLIMWHKGWTESDLSTVQRLPKPSEYKEAVLSFLSWCQTNAPGLMVVITMDMTLFIKNYPNPDPPYQRFTHYWEYIDEVVGDNDIRSKPNLLGWYIDEVDNHLFDDSWTGDANSWYNWHNRIKTLDSDHPIFAVMANKSGRMDVGFPSSNTNRVYDVLMQDSYPFTIQPPDYSSDNDQKWNDLRVRFSADDNTLGPLSSTVAIPQGIGTEWSGFADPTIAQIKYQVFSYLWEAQVQGFNPGGVIWWVLGQSATLNQRYGSFISYFNEYQLAAIVSSSNRNSNLSSSEPQVKTFMRFMGNSIYIVAVNQTDNSINGVSLYATDPSFNQYTFVDELEVPGQTIQPFNSTFWGQTCYLTTNFAPREAKLYRIGSGTWKIGGETLSETSPTIFALYQNSPNPFNPQTTILYQLPTVSHVRVAVYDLLGREIVTLVDEQKEAGVYTTMFKATNVGSGVYLYRMQAGSFSMTKKLVVLR